MLVIKRISAASQNGAELRRHVLGLLLAFLAQSTDWQTDCHKIADSLVDSQIDALIGFLHQVDDQLKAFLWQTYKKRNQHQSTIIAFPNDITIHQRVAECYELLTENDITFQFALMHYFLRAMKKENSAADIALMEMYYLDYLKIISQIDMEITNLIAEDKANMRRNRSNFFMHKLEAK